MEGRELSSEPFIWYVTASMKIDYHKPTPIDRPVTLRATVEKREGKKSVVYCGLYSEGERRATGEVLAVRLSPEKWFV
jgi:acyl-CoA thioesterase FadM